MTLTQVTTEGIKAGTITGSDLATNIDLVDNQKLRFGNSQDLKIYHDGSESWIKDTGTGDLNILATDLQIKTADDTEFFLTAVANGAVSLYHNGSKKFETTSNGATIDGGSNVSMDSSGNGQLKVNGSGYSGAIALDGTAMNIYHNSASRAIVFGINETEKMRIDSSGNIGIGTASPSDLLNLDVDTESNLGSGSKGIRLTSGSSNTQLVRLGSSYSNNSVTGPGTLLYSSNKLSIRCDNGNPITFHTGSTVAERMRIDSSGNITVFGDIISASNGDIDFTPNGTGAVVFKGVSGNGGNGAGRFKLNCEVNSHGITIQGPPHSAGANYTLTLPNNVVNGQFLKTDSNGNLSWSAVSGTTINNNANNRVITGSGTANTLEGESGLTYDGSTLSVSGSVTATGNITAFSDVALKEDINTISDALTKILNLRGVSYSRKDTKQKSIGVIAQEVEKILPEVVENGEYKSVAYGNIVALLIEAVKDLNREIQLLKK